MRPFLDDLSPLELRVLARIRLAVTARLVAAAVYRDPALAELIARPFQLALKVPGLPRALVAGLDGRVSAWAGGAAPSLRLPADLTLLFPSPRDCARVLDGASGRVFPIPGGLGAGRALRFFRAAASAAPRILKSPDTPSAVRAELLLEAAVSALVETAAADPYAAPKLEHAPDGLLVVDAGEGVRRALRKEGIRLRLVPVPGSESCSTGAESGPSGAEPPNGTNPAGAGRPGGGRTKAARADAVRIDAARTDAILAFRDPEAAVAVLSGKKSAVTALGACEASIRGLVPLVQSLFAVLDRASRYLAVQAEREAGHGR